MTIPLRLGYKASAEQFGPGELLDFAVLAEEVGFDSVFVSDHLQPWLHDGGHAPASVPLLGALGARTSRVLIGTSVLTPTFRYNPTVIAQEFATLGALYPGRVILGVGTGEALNEANLGFAWPDPPERFQRLKEALGLIDRLWSEERVSFDGTFYTTRNVTIYDRPDERVPVYIGAAGPAATRLAGRIADGFITTSGKKPELYTDTLLPALDEGLRKEGRTRDDIDTLMEVKVSLADTLEEGREKTRFWAPLALSPDEKMRSRSSAPPRGSSSRTIPTSTSSGSPGTSSRASATSSSTTRVTTRRPSSAATARRSSRVCASVSARDRHRPTRPLGRRRPGQARRRGEVAPAGRRCAPHRPRPCDSPGHPRRRRRVPPGASARRRRR